MSRLLPSSHEEFRSKTYWDKFFQERGKDAFEWYGNYEEMKEVILGSAPAMNSRILVIGCGNSEFSHDMYDGGYKCIRNQDYSSIVIEEMKSKNNITSNSNDNKRPGMLWDLGDMTHMPEYQDESFDVVLDKGALDALMSVDSEDTRRKANDMFAEISRVLANSSNGKYVCITLAESFILDTLVSYFIDDRATSAGEDGGAQAHWSVEVHTFSTTGRSSPFKPLVAVFTKQKKKTVKSSIECYVSSIGDRIGKEQGFYTSETTLETSAQLKRRITQIQAFAQKSFEMGDLTRGRADTFEVWSDNEGDLIPRYTIMVVDAVGEGTENSKNPEGKLSCAIFMVPMGRESAYEFSTATGLEGIAALANCKRLIAVRCNLPHTFSADQAELQRELDPHVVPLFPTCKGETEQVPYMAVGNDDSWVRIAAGTSKASGAYIVEEADADDDDEEDEKECEINKSSRKKLRRLRFLQNQHFVQTEVQLNSPEDGDEGEAPSLVSTSEDGDNTRYTVHSQSAGTGVTTPRSMSAAEAAADMAWTWGTDTNSNMRGLRFDEEYVDSHHVCALAAMSLNPAMLLKATASSSTASTSGGEWAKGMVIGLGGGAFPMFAQGYLPHCHTIVADLDANMLELAVHFFGYNPDPRKVSFAPREGVELLLEMVENTKQKEATATAAGAGAGAGAPSSKGPSQALAGPLDYIFLDVDSKDSSLGLSAPPEPFLAPESLEAAYSLLCPGGLLIVNVVARNKALLADLQKKFIDTFCNFGAANSDGNGTNISKAKEAASEDDVRAMFRAMTTADGGDAMNALDVSDTIASMAVGDIDGDDDDIDGDDDGIDCDNGNNDSKTSSKQSLQTEKRRRGRVFLIRPGDDVVNLILVAVKEGSPDTVAGLGPAGAVSVNTRSILDLGAEQQQPANARDRIRERDAALKAWLAGVARADDPCQMRKMALKIETIA
jgi:hypothetical protein